MVCSWIKDCFCESLHMDFLSKIPKDKLLHSFYGTLTYIIISFFSHNIAMFSVIALAVSKEVYDDRKYGGFDWKDIVATIIIPLLLYIQNIAL